jgi:hypothetical protein
MNRIMRLKLWGRTDFYESLPDGLPGHGRWCRYPEQQTKFYGCWEGRRLSSHYWGHHRGRGANCAGTGQSSRWDRAIYAGCLRGCFCSRWLMPPRRPSLMYPRRLKFRPTNRKPTRLRPARLRQIRLLQTRLRQIRVQPVRLLQIRRRRTRLRQRLRQAESFAES